MNKKILIGSIIAVVILVLVSFTGVVGYQTTSSTIARVSPLFSVRTSRALDKESKDLTRDYIGKDEDNFLSIPKRDDRTALVQKFIDSISKMDDERFNILVKFVSRYLSRYSKYSDVDFDDLVEALKLLRNKPNEKQLSRLNDIPILTSFVCTSGNQWEPGCIINWVVELVILNVFLFIIFILKLLTGGEFTTRCYETIICDTIDCTYYCVI